MAVGGPNSEENPDAGSGGSAGGGPPHRHHRVRSTLLVVLGVVVLGVVVVVLAYVLRDQPGPRSIASARHQFQATTTTAPTPKAFALPPAGVYRATGSGTERIDKPPNSETDGPNMPITITYLSGGCWRWRIDYNTAHWHEYDYCPQGARLMLVGQRNYLSFDYGLATVSNLAQFTCRPPSPIALESPRPGETFPHRCTGTNTAVAGLSTAAGPVTIVGVGTLDVGGVQVPAIHATRIQHISGAQTGLLDESWWFAASTGMPLQESRNYKLTTKSPIGSITYTEVGSWHLDSMQPVT